MSAKKPISVTLDPDVLAAIQVMVKEGRASSVSAMINETLQNRIERERAAKHARAYIVEQLLGGLDFTDEELTEASGRLAASKARAAARRGAGGATA